jgi:hypothetical protein
MIKSQWDAVKFKPNPLPPLRELQNDVEEAIDEAEEEDRPYLYLDEEAGSSLLLFYALGWTEIEQMIDLLLEQELICFERNSDNFERHREGVRYLIPHINLSAKIEFLYRMQVIDGTLKNQIEQIRGKRNNLIHQSFERHTPGEDYGEYASTVVETAEELNHALDLDTLN